MASDGRQDIVIELIAQFADFVRDAQNATDQVSSHFERMQGRVQDSVDNTVSGASDRFNTGFAAAGAAAADSFIRALSDTLAAASTIIGAELLGNFIEQQVDKAAELAHSLGRFATEMGTTPAAIQRLQYALAGVGVSGDAAESSLRRMAMTIEHAVDAHNGKSMIERLGLDPKALKAEDFNKQITDIGTSIMRLASPTERMAAAMQVFGRYGAADMLTLFAEGADGINKAEKAADKFGAVLDNKLIAELQKLHDDMAQAAQTAKVFAANLIEPIIIPIDNLVLKLQSFRAEFGKMVESVRTNITIGGTAGGLIAFGTLLSVLGKFGLLPGLLSPVAASLGAMLVPLGQAIAIGFLLYNAWQTDFGGIKEMLGDVVLGVEAFAEKAREFFSTVSGIIGRTIEPALQHLGEVLRPVFKAFGEFIAGLGGSQKVWGYLAQAVQVAASVLEGVIRFIADVAIPVLENVYSAGIQFLNWFQQLPGAAQLLGYAILFFLSPFDEMLLGFGTFVLVAGTVLIKLGQFIPIFGTIATWFFALSGLVLLFAAEFLYVLANWNTMVAGWHEGASVIEEWIARLILAFSGFTRAIADFVSKVPVIGSAMAKPFEQAADAAERAAMRISVAGEIQHETAQDVFTQGAGPRVGPGAMPDWLKKAIDELTHPKNTGPGALPPPPDAKTHADAVRNAIEDQKEALEKFKDAITATEEKIQQAQASLKMLGEIDTPRKLAQAQNLVTQEIKLTNQERAEQIKLAKAAGDAAAHLHSLEMTESAPKIKHEYHRATVSLNSEQNHAQTKAIELQTKDTELAKQKVQLTKDYYANQLAITPTISNRIALLNDELDKLTKQHATAKMLAEVHKQILDLMAARKNAALSTQEAEIKAQIDTINNRQKLAEAASKGFVETPARKRNLEEASARDSVDTARLENDANKAKRDAAQQALDAASAVKSTDEAELIKLTQALRDADESLINSTTRLNITQQEQANLQSAGARKLNDDFNNLAKEAAGPLYTAFENISTNLANHMSPTASILEGAFMALAKDSRAFNDVQKVMTSITEALAKVFDALRPVVDLLLGVLTGVVNMFIGLFNVIASILRIFGIQIQQIQMVNDKLAVLGQGVPLLQITHDLPTANEYNQGKFGPLITQQMQQQANSLNNNLTVGFNSQLNKLGEILGALIGIKLLLAVAGVGPSLGAIFGQHGGKGGPLSILGGLFSTGSGNASTPGAVGGESTTTGGGDWGTGGAADQTLQNAVGPNGTESDVLQRHMGSGGTLDTTLGSFLAKFGPMLAALGTTLANSKGGTIGAAGGGIAGIFSAMAQVKSGKSSTGSMDTANYAAGGMELFQGLSQGGTAQQTLGGAGDIVGTIFGGPVGGAIGQAIGSVIGSFLGPKLSAAKNPDIEATQQYGQGFADIMGSQQANGQQFTESSTALQQTGGSTIGDYISKYIAQTGGAGLSQQTISLFKNFQDGMTSLHNGVVTFKNGATGMWSDILNSAQTAMTAIQANTAYMASNAANILQGAVSMNLGTSFGNGSVSAVNGGFSVTPGGGMLANGDFGGGGSGQSVMINIENVHGADPDALRQAFIPIVSQIQEAMARQRAQVTRTQRHSYGRTS